MKIKGCVLSFFSLALGVLSLVGLVGLIIYFGIWWGKIRYDFPYRGLKETEPYKLYLAVLFSWVLPILAFGSATAARIPECCELKLVSTLFLTLTIWSGLGEIAVVILAIVWSMPKNCEIIKNSIFEAKNASGFGKWYDKQTSGMTVEEKEKFDKDLPAKRCDNPHKMIIIYSSLFIGSIVLSFVFVLLTMYCNNEKHPELEQLTDNTKIEFGLT